MRERREGRGKEGALLSSADRVIILGILGREEYVFLPQKSQIWPQWPQTGPETQMAGAPKMATASQMAPAPNAQSPKWPQPQIAATAPNGFGPKMMNSMDLAIEDIGARLSLPVVL